MSSADLQPGTRVRHKDGTIVVLDRRKAPGDSEFGFPGWWLRDDPGGLADIVIDDASGDWTVLADAATTKSPEIVALQSLDLADIESRLDPLRPDRAADVTNEEVAHLLCIARDYDAGLESVDTGGGVSEVHEG